MLRIRQGVEALIRGLVTVVIPVYNVEEYLDRCVASVVGQTYRNLEIILVDDGSTDRSPELCDQWVRRDQRIKVIHKQNEDAGLARNAGIDCASGEYICFFDSDDCVEPVLIEACDQMAISENADVVSFGSDNNTTHRKKYQARIPSPPKPVYTGIEIKEELLPRLLSYDTETGEDWKLLLTVWSSMFSMRVIHKTNWRFVSQKKYISEDFYSLFELYQHVQKVVYIPQVFYHYTINPVSLSHVYHKNRYMRIKQLAKDMIQLSRHWNCDVRAELDTMFLNAVIGTFKLIASSAESARVKLCYFGEIVNDDYLQTVLRTHVSSNEGFAKRSLYWSMKRRKAGLCYLLSVIRNLKG